MAQFKSAIAAIALFGVASFAHAAPWFGDARGVHRVDPATNQVDVNISSPTPVALAVNEANASVWSLTASRIAHYSGEGALLFDAPLSSQVSRHGGARVLALNSTDGSVWFATQNKLSHLDASGALLGALSVSAEDMDISRDGTLWVLLQKELRHYSSQGALLGSTSLPASEHQDDLLELDDAAGKVWTVSERRLTQRDAGDPSRISVSVTLPDVASGLSLDAQTGTIWVLSNNQLLAYSRAGASQFSKDLRSLSIQKTGALAFDAGQQAVWVGHSRGLSRVSTAGALIATLASTSAVESIAVGDFSFANSQPTLALVQPQPGTFTNAQPTIVFQYGATCSGAPCGLPNSAYASYSLTATLDGNPVDYLFNFNPVTGQASFQPFAPLAEGLHELSGQVSNSSGKQSETVTARFTVDTLAPRLLALSPANNSVLSTPQLVLSGMVDDAQATVRLSTGQSATGGTFSFPVTLSLGANALSLTATDLAGNVSTQSLSYTYEPPNTLPTVALTGPANGDNFSAPASVTLTASASDSDGAIVRVDFFSNGSLLGSDTTSPYSFALSNLAVGTYTFTAQATDNRGGVTTSEPVTVTVGPPNILPVVALKSPASGTSFSAPASVRAVAIATDSDGSIAKVEFLLDGAVAATVLAPPYEATLSGVPAGAHSLVARATDDRGGRANSSPATLSVTATALTIYSPVNNASVGGNSVLVTGNAAGLPNSGVSVNGVVAALDTFGNFSAVVPLVEGGNTLTAQLTTPDGTTLTSSVTVLATGEASPFSVKADPLVGLAPVAATFTLENPTSADATFTFDGYGPYSLPAGSTSQLSLTYPAGVFAPTVVITTADGRNYTHPFVIDSRDPARMDQMFRALWSGMNQALVAGDKEGAMRYLNSGAQAKYGPVFDTLMPYMADIVGSYSPLAKSSISSQLAEYAVTRVNNGRKQLYLISYLQDIDGVWRIDEM